MESCKHDKNLSKFMTKAQNKLKKNMPKIEEFLATDFTYQEPTEEQAKKQ